jgi:type IV fimbrial biogenesis protein FimT
MKAHMNLRAVPPKQCRRPPAGFTLYELIITVAFIAVLAALATPSFREFIATQRVRNASFDLVSALTLVRSEAIKTNASADLTRKGTNWASGWTVTATIGGTPTTLLDHDAFNGVKITDSAGLGVVTYAKDGRTTSAATKFQIEPATTLSGVKLHCVSIGLSGIPTSSVGQCT